MDRNSSRFPSLSTFNVVALRKESVDRNFSLLAVLSVSLASLSARRAWIEMPEPSTPWPVCPVALRKESVDRNNKTWWVDIHTSGSRSPQGERG